MNEPERLDTIERIATTLQTNPQIVAESLWRLGRFGGAHPTSNVLTHTIALCNDPEIVAAGLDAVLCAALHDVHEIITGEIPRPYKTDECMAIQSGMTGELIDWLDVSFSWETWTLMESRDTFVGDEEHRLWGLYPHSERSDCIDEFCRVIKDGLAR